MAPFWLYAALAECRCDGTNRTANTIDLIEVVAYDFIVTLM